MDDSLAKELRDAGFPQNGQSCDHQRRHLIRADRTQAHSPSWLTHVRSTWAPLPLS